MNCSEKLDRRIRFRQSIFAFFILGDLWMSFLSLLNVLNFSVGIKNCCREKPPDCLRLMILEAALHLLVLKRGNLFDAGELLN